MQTPTTQRFDEGSAWTAARHAAATGETFTREDFTTDRAFAQYADEVESYRRQLAIDAKWTRAEVR